MAEQMLQLRRPANAGLQDKSEQRSGTVLSDRRANAATARELPDFRTPVQAKKTELPAPSDGLPPALKNGIENLSGMNMDHVRVHLNSSRPAQLNAHAYAQGNQIHVGPGQEQHLPHEAWHVVQQAQGRVQPSSRLVTGTPVNDDAQLEREADVMGAKAVQLHGMGLSAQSVVPEEAADGMDAPLPAIQCKSVIPAFTGFSNEVVQRLVGAAAIAGHDEVLPGVAANRSAAAVKIAQFINLRARETVAPAVGVAAQHENTSALGAHNAGNLYVRSDYTHAGHACQLEAWAEMTPGGGGYVKRVRVIENNVTIMDRVMDDAAPTVLNAALMVNAGAGAVHRYDPMHTTNAADSAALEIRGTGERDADNLTKVIGEGARFGWLSEKLANRRTGNDSRDVLQLSITIPQAGTFTMNPTFQQLWGAWASAFGRSYMKNKAAAKVLLKQRLTERLRSPREGDLPGGSPLGSGHAAAAQVTSLEARGGAIMLMPVTVNGVSGADIITDLGMTWTADH